MRMLETRWTLALTLGLVACSGAPNPHTAQVGDAPTASPSQAALPSSSVAIEPSARPPVASTGPWVDLEASPGDAALEPGAEAVGAGDWATARRKLEPALGAIDGAALDVRLAAHALLGRACAELTDAPCATKEYGAILAAWKGAESVAEVEAAGGSGETARAERRRRALLAVGEALYFQAEEKRAIADKLMMPSYSGNGERRSVQTFIEDKVAPWVKAKKLLIDEAEAAYAKIAALEPEAPPRWWVDASARVGQLEGKFVAQFRAAPIPKEWLSAGFASTSPSMTWAEVREAYYAALDEASAPLKELAFKAFETCQRVSLSAGYKDEFSRSCDAWLEKNR